MSTENLKHSKESIIKKLSVSPRMLLGKYKGLKVSQITNRQYLQWITEQDFGDEYVEAAKIKLEILKKSTDIKIEITRHAYDSFSLRFLYKWQAFNSHKIKPIGIGTFISELAQQALDKGKDISEEKNKTDRIIFYSDIKFVFNKGTDIPVLITVCED